MKKAVIVLGAILVLCAVIGIIASVGGSKQPSVEPGPAAQSAQSAAKVQPAAEAKSTPASKPTDTPKPQQVGISRSAPVPVGASFTAPNGISIVVVGFEQGPAVTKKLKEANMFNSEPGPGNKHALVTVTVTNTKQDDKVVRVSSSSFGLVGSSGKIFNPVFAVVAKSLSAELFSGGKTTGEIPFEIPADEKDIVLIYDAAAFGGTRYFFALPQ